MTPFEDLICTLNWILDTPLADQNALNSPEFRLPWRLEISDLHGFAAELQAVPEEFVIRVDSSVWRRLEVFCACGIDWKASALEPLSKGKAFDYSQAEWETIIQLTHDFCDWSTIETAATRLQESSLSHRRMPVPLAMHAVNGMRAHTAAAYFGYLWLICHEGTHAWKQHYQLVEMPIKESIRRRSELLAGFELDRTCESEADWQATKFIFAHILDCVLAGYSSGLAYAAGFGTSAAILMLNPLRHNVWDRAGQHDPGWMRLHFVLNAAKAGYWWILEAYYPEYAALMRRRGGPGILSRNTKGIAPKPRFDKRAEKALRSFWLGQHHALRFAQAIGDANTSVDAAHAGLFKFGEPDDWKEFQIMVMDGDLLKRRERARNELSRLLPADSRFQSSGPLGHGASLKLAFLAAAKKNQ